MTERAWHEPVLRKEVVEYLAPEPGKSYVDCTTGDGGHLMDILKHLGGGGPVIGIDLDPHMAARVIRRIEHERLDPTPVKLINGNFGDLTLLLQHTCCSPSGGILLDLGPSTPQLLDPKLGLSWTSDEALDMRLGPGVGGLTASEIVNEWSEGDLARLFRDYAQEKWSRLIARRIVDQRGRRPIGTGKELGELVANAVPKRAWPRKIHVATRVFMALRMKVNRELENLEAVLPQAVDLLAPGARLLVISFHSGEDSIVKNFMREMARPAKEAPWPLPNKEPLAPPRLKILTRRPVWPTDEEVQRNPRARSARLRAAEKI